MSVVASRPGASKSFACVVGVYLGDGAVTLWRMASKADRLVFRLNTIDEELEITSHTLYERRYL